MLEPFLTWVRGRAERPAKICLACGTLHDEDAVRCDLHPGGLVAIGSDEWKAQSTHATPDAGPPSRARRVAARLAQLSLLGVLAALGLTLYAYSLGTADGIFALYFAILVPIFSFFALHGWVVPRARRQVERVRAARSEVLVLFALSLAVLLGCVVVMVFDLRLPRMPEHFGAWLLYALVAPLASSSGYLAASKDFRFVWMPPERDASTEPTPHPDARTGTVEGTGIVGYVVRALPTRSLGPIDGHTRGLRVALDDGSVARFDDGLLRFVAPAEPSFELDEDELSELASWWRAEPEAALQGSGAHVWLLRGGDRVAIHGELAREAVAGESYRDPVDVTYHGTAPVYLERLED